MPLNNEISIIAVSDKDAEENKHGTGYTNEGIAKKPADFETAIAAAGNGKFQYLLLLAVIPVSWAISIDTSNVAIILPSAECDLQMTLFQKGVLNAINFVGMVLSGFLWGYVADMRGRRVVFMYGFLADGICNVLSGFSQNFWTLAFFKFLSGCIISGPHAAIMTYCPEFHEVKSRVKVALIVGFTGTFGNIMTAGMAWLIIPQTWSIVLWDGAFVYNSWRIFLSLCGIPILIGVGCLSFFPESPKFLMSQGRNEDALKVFKLIYRLNTGRSAQEYPISRLEDKSHYKADQTQKSHRTAIFFNPHLPRLIMVTVLQFGAMLEMNTIRLWQPQLFTMLENFQSQYNGTEGNDSTFCEIMDLSIHKQNNFTADAEGSICVNTVVNESVYMNTVIIAAFTNLCLLVTNLTLNIVNHKTLLSMCYGVAISCIVYLNWSTNMLSTLILTCLFIGLMHVAMNMVIGVAVILFPTSLRTIAVSLVMTTGRLGSMIGSLLFPVLLAHGCLAPIISLAIFIIICIVSTYFLPLAKKTKK
ncbi:synaptic vesicle glycoprotein 2A-like [Colletes gigas]|uniref:synaptic vesicle glycoprotein 2A-like n=1 Tax=Colletes gigas TaxID=935657 RepID=UPI001C9B48C1|nr:synaptic vesicle glycoprotein 2A-like [Colletes gigas]